MTSRRQKGAIITGRFREAMRLLSPYLEAEPVIYGLLDPLRRDTVAYVGRAVDPISRYRQHCSYHYPESDRKREWLRDLRARNLFPGFAVLESSFSRMGVGQRNKAMSERESHWIWEMKQRGLAWLNKPYGVAPDPVVVPELALPEGEIDATIAMAERVRLEKEITRQAEEIEALRSKVESLRKRLFGRGMIQELADPERRPGYIRGL